MANFTDMKAAEKFAEFVGYPVLVRPSYVLSGSAMSVCYNPKPTFKFCRQAVNGSGVPGNYFQIHRKRQGAGVDAWRKTVKF